MLASPKFSRPLYTMGEAAIPYSLKAVAASAMFYTDSVRVKPWKAVLKSLERLYLTLKTPYESYPDMLPKFFIDRDL